MLQEKNHGDEDFGKSPKDQVDSIDYLSESSLQLLKVERVLIAFAFFILLGLALRNVWKYLIKGKMYKSYPILLSYILLVVYSALSVVYELYMGFGCGGHDCFDQLLV